MVSSEEKNSLKRLFFSSESLRSDFSSEACGAQNKSVPESVSPSMCSHKGEEFLQFIIPQNALSPLRGALPQGEPIKVSLEQEKLLPPLRGPPPSGGRQRTVGDACPYEVDGQKAFVH